MIGLVPDRRHLDVLCLGAHPDDIEIGCGGTLLTLAARGDVDVTAVVLSASEERRREFEESIPRFVPGATVEVHALTDGHLPGEWWATKDTLEDLARRVRPDVVLAPRRDDAHQDHRLIGELVATVWRDALVLHYEIPKWDGDLGRPSTYVGLPPEIAHRKVELLDDCYPSQKDRDWWDDELFLGLMRMRGVECRERYAEAFWTDKLTLRLSQGDT